MSRILLFLAVLPPFLFGALLCLLSIEAIRRRELGHVWLWPVSGVLLILSSFATLWLWVS